MQLLRERIEDLLNLKNASIIFYDENGDSEIKKEIFQVTIECTEANNWKPFIDFYYYEKHHIIKVESRRVLRLEVNNDNT